VGHADTHTDATTANLKHLYSILIKAFIFEKLARKPCSNQMVLSGHN